MTLDVSQNIRQRLLNGDRTVLAEAFEMEHARLWHLVHFRMDARLRARLDPDDILQEAYLATASRVAHFLSSDVSFMVWLRSIVMQTLIDLHRRHLGTQQRSATLDISLHNRQSHDDTSCCLVSALSGGFTSPSQAAIRNEAEAALLRGLQQLNERDREIIALRHFELLNNTEVAEVLGIQPKNASIRYVRAMSSLKNILESSGMALNGNASLNLVP
ncbi:MAG: sigma-70 family RNA polymerase sigma factor [Pirellulaceae bacterium]|nr:sigma-70 family RNA polymerase sigma factor [Pirellulaceae bacterium]